MSPCNHEEADSRICIHVQHALQNGARNILVSTVDTDVIVILVGAYFSFLDTFPDMNIFVGFGTGKHFKINSICQSLGKEKSRALPFFHTFTGCDTTSQFLGKGKKSAWESWISYPEVTKAFLFAQEHPFRLLQLQSSQMELLERYVCILYDRTTAMCLVNELRKELFCKRAKTMDGIPPTQVKFNHGFCYIFHHILFVVTVCPSTTFKQGLVSSKYLDHMPPRRHKYSTARRIWLEEE